jgi:hypothetical protein
MSKDNRRVTAANFARLQLPPPQTPSSAATASESPATPNASASSWSGTWGTRSPRPHNPVWAAPEPAALAAPTSHALTVPGEPCAVGESSLRAFSVA